MNKSKKIAVVLFLSIAIFIVVNIGYNSIINQRQRFEIYVVCKDVKRGEVITKNDVKRVYTNEIIDGIVDANFIKDRMDKFVIKSDISKNNILFYDNFINKDEYINASLNKEIISIKFKAADNIVSYLVRKNSVINLYLTARNKYIEELNIEKETMLSSSDDGYGTIELLSNVKVLDVFDKEGNSIRDNNTNVSKVIDSVLVEVDKKDAKIINNLKGIGDFNITLIR